MTHIERKLFHRNLIFGVVISLLVAAAYHVGWLMPLERWFYDRRARDCQFFTPPPTDALVHLDIDDSSIEAIGRWPWPRAKLAAIVDEVRLAQASALAFDVVFSEPQESRFEIDDQGNAGPRIDDDQIFSDALKRYGRVILSVAVKVKSPSGPVEQKTKQILRDNPTITLEIFESLLKDSGIRAVDLPAGKNIQDLFVQSRNAAWLYFIEHQLDERQITFEQVCSELAPQIDTKLISEAPVLNVLRTLYDKALSIRIVRSTANQLEAALPHAANASPDLPPISILAGAAERSGFVTYLPESDGVVRAMPLFVNDGKSLIPQLGLTLACAYQRTKAQDIQITNRYVTVPGREGSQVDIPIHTRTISSEQGETDAVINIPWFGPTDRWEFMYDPEGKQSLQHVPLNRIWQVALLARKIRQNNAQIDAAATDVLSDEQSWQLALDPLRAKKYLQSIEGPEDTAARTAIVDALKKDEALSEYLKYFREIDVSTLSDEEKSFRNALLRAFDAMELATQQNKQLVENLERGRKELKNLLAGKACLVGWVSTAAIADFVPTSVHHKCPGVVVHGAIFNAILTGHVLRVAPHWATLLISIFIGLLTTSFVARLTPTWSLFGALTIGVGYVALNGVILYDWGNIVIGAAGPVTAVLIVWSLCTLNRFISERAERARITRRFSSYADPALVDYVISNPDRAQLSGEERELSVVFTDLQGFTTLSEKLGKSTVQILNEYLGIMVPIIKERDGYVNKFLGDGIMFFFGAPIENRNHTIDAVTTVLAMQRAMPAFNRALQERGLPQVFMRVGISSGEMIVGDAGTSERADYTVLGDVVNLSARLESGNKYTGTWILINDRAAKLCGDQFLLRPVARLQVVGKSESVMTYEPLAVKDEATDEQLVMAERTAEMIDAFTEGRFTDAITAADELNELPDQEKLVKLYKLWAQRHLDNPPDGDFDGTIELTEK